MLFTYSTFFISIGMSDNMANCDFTYNMLKTCNQLTLKGQQERYKDVLAVKELLNEISSLAVQQFN